MVECKKEAGYGKCLLDLKGVGDLYEKEYL